jgi:general secretion pathway protein G
VNSRHASGFTLIEILVVLVILGLLAGLVGPRIFGNVDKANVKTAGIQVKMLKGAIQIFRLDVGRIPNADEGLAVLVADKGVSRWDGPYLEEGLPLDPWNNPYVYKPSPSGTQPFTLFSTGSDGAVGGEGTAADIGYVPEQ